MKIAFFLVVEGLGMVHFSLVSHSHGAVMFLGIIWIKVHRGGASYICLPFTFPLDQPSAHVTSGTPLGLPLHPPPPFRPPSTLTMTPLLASQPPCLWPSYSLNHTPFTRAAKAWYVPILESFSSSSSSPFTTFRYWLMFCVLQSLFHLWQCHGLWTGTQSCILHNSRGHYIPRLHYKLFPIKLCRANLAQLYSLSLNAFTLFTIPDFSLFLSSIFSKLKFISYLTQAKLVR